MTLLAGEHKRLKLGLSSPNLMKRFLLILVFLLFACTPQVSECEGLESYYSFDDLGYPVISKELIAYFPECANDLAAKYGVDNFHVGTFAERREFFGPEWEEMFKKEACVDRSWEERMPTICIQ